MFDIYQRDVHATNARYIKYTCPIFNKYIICASGFNETVKNEIKELVESEGGTYSGDLVCGTTTHLVSNEAKGSKYEHAKMWKINVVKSTWIYESKKARYCMPEKEYQLETSNQTSTPTDHRVLAKNQRAPEIDLSVITKAANQSVMQASNATKLVNESENITRNANGSFQSMLNHSNMTMPAPAPPSSKSNSIKPMTNYADLTKELNLIGKINYSLFDGIGVSLFILFS